MKEKRKVSKKNIDEMLVDVKRPDYDYAKFSKVKPVNLVYSPQAPSYRLRKIKNISVKILLSLLAVFFATVIFSFLSIGRSKNIFIENTKEVVGNFSEAVQALYKFNPSEAEILLLENKEMLDKLRSILRRGYGDKLLSIFGEVLPPAKDAGELIERVYALNEDALSVSRSVGELSTGGFSYFKSDGKKLISLISDVKLRMSSIALEMEGIRNTIAPLSKFSDTFKNFEGALSDEYLKGISEFAELDSFLDGMVSVFESEEEKHILVLFQNIAEVRPGGGFVGSYADVSVKNGQLQSVDVRDVYDPDGQLDLDIVPPYEIQTMTTNWGARDGNWFFDFPTSAKAFLYLVESSKMYSEEKNITFEGVIGMNVNVFLSVLDAVGPIEFEDYDFELTSENFLNEVQREVEAGEDKASGQPKKILMVTAPIVLERLGNLSEEEMKNLINRLGVHFAMKDIMVYMKDRGMQAFIESRGIDGGVYALPGNFLGSYLAVVNANVAGGKSDAFMKQSIKGRVDLDSNGGVFTDLAVTRRHEGDKEKDYWWRAENKDFIQVYTNPGSALISLEGETVKSAYSRFDYEKNDYIEYPDLKKIEDTKIYLPNFHAWSMQAFGKAAFGTWLFTPAGKEKTLELRYTLEGDRKISAGDVFTFVFEKQSGVETSLYLDIGAPLGYRWKESQSPVFIYKNANPEKREVIQLTLIK